MYCKPAVKKSDLLKMAQIHSMKLIHCSLAMFCLTFSYTTGFFSDSVQINISLNLTLEPAEINEAYPEAITLRCELNKSETVKIEKFSIMRILKYDPSDASRKKWLSVKEKKDVEVSDAVLEITWPAAVTDAFGLYHCDALGRSENSDVVLGKSEDVSIKLEGLTTGSMLQALLKTRAELQEAVDKNSKQIAEVGQRVKGLLEKEDQRSLTINERLMKTEISRETVVRQLMFSPRSTHWPGGRYALLQPDSGCPLDLSFYGGNTGYFKIHAESTSGVNKTSYDANSHIAQPFLTSHGDNTFATLKFCTTNGAFSSKTWPSGQYCIHMVGSSCPSGLSVSHITIPTEKTNNKDEEGGDAPRGEPSHLYFCCKRDTNPAPMVMPTNTPFYLYRFSDKCQEIKGMKVDLHYFQIGTEGNSVCSGGCPYYIPGNAGSIRFELCYYSKS